MAASSFTSRRESEIWDRLDRVMDPELDEPITDMGFVEEIRVDDRDIVTVGFRLPTYWCSPNFAFLMAESIRREVEKLAWVSQVLVRLEDHLSADEMNAGVNQGRSFSEVFADMSDGGNLEDLRHKFDGKAFQRRQEVGLKALLAADYSIPEIVAMTLQALQNITFADPADQLQKNRYLELLLSKGLACLPSDPAFTTYAGSPLTVEGFAAYKSELRSVRINMEFNGALCRGLKNARYKEVQPVDGEPTLVDFILDRVPKPPPQAEPGSITPAE